MVEYKYYTLSNIVGNRVLFVDWNYCKGKQMAFQYNGCIDLKHVIMLQQPFITIHYNHIL